MSTPHDQAMGGTVLAALRRHIAMMAPHRRDREGGRLLLAAEAEISRLQASACAGSNSGAGTTPLDLLEAMARQYCHTTLAERDYNGQVAGTFVTDSGALSAEAAALRALWAANPPRFRIVAEAGRMVVGYWPEEDPAAGAVKISDSGHQPTP